MRTVAFLSAVCLAGAKSSTQCILDGAEAGNELMDSAIFTWASVERCEKGAGVECEIDSASAIESVTGMIGTIVKAIDKCHDLHTINRGCGEASTDLIKSVAGLSAASGEIITHCEKKEEPKKPAAAPCDIVAPSVPEPVSPLHPAAFAKNPINVAKCAVNIKSSLNSLMKAIKDIVKMKKDCKEGSADCDQNAEKLVSALTGLGAYLSGAVSHCRPEPGLAGCAHAVASLIHNLAGIGEAADKMSVQCSLPNHGEGPKHVTEVVEVPNPLNVPSRLYKQEHTAISATAGMSSNLILAAFLPITAIVSFVGGRFYANRRSHTTQVREVMDEHEIE